MREFAFLILMLLLVSCVKKVNDKQPARLYFLGSCRKDTNFIEKLSFDTTKLTVIASEDFSNERYGTFRGEVFKLSNEPAPVDGGMVYYLTPDLGIIFSKSTTWLCYNRLHSTNDSIEKRINEYIEHILSKTELVIRGEVPPLGETIKFVPPVVEDK